jgi:hypothetical protein
MKPSGEWVMNTDLVVDSGGVGAGVGVRSIAESHEAVDGDVAPLGHPFTLEEVGHARLEAATDRRLARGGHTQQDGERRIGGSDRFEEPIEVDVDPVVDEQRVDALGGDHPLDGLGVGFDVDVESTVGLADGRPHRRPPAGRLREQEEVDGAGHTHR